MLENLVSKMTNQPLYNSIRAELPLSLNIPILSYIFPNI